MDIAHPYNHCLNNSHCPQRFIVTVLSGSTFLVQWLALPLSFWRHQSVATYNVQAPDDDDDEDNDDYDYDYDDDNEEEEGEEENAPKRGNLQCGYA